MDFEKKNNIYKSVMLVIVTVLVTCLITAVGSYNYYTKTEEGLAKALGTIKSSNLDTKLKVVKRYLDEFYLGNTSDEEKLNEYAIKGYVAGLGDIYTEYLTKDEYEELMIDVNGDFVGIGIYMAKDRYENVIVLLPIEGSPAEEAGLKTGDIITKVNGEDCQKMELTTVANKIKGEEGTTVNLEIQRGEEIINKDIMRKKVKINYLRSKLLDKGIGYIGMNSFDKDCSIEFKKELENLQNKNIKSLIIDLRNNGGGIVDEVTEIAELFLPKHKVIMNEIGKNNKENKIISKEDKKVKDDIKIVIITNENSASASEIFVGALKDNGIAKVVGTKTFGKGVMQEIVPVSTGGALKITIKEFHTPNGNKINKNGIMPDVEIEDDLKTDEDEQLNKAIEMCK